VSEAPASGKIVTFYSYKGGTGRSMAVANVAWVLASSGKRVLVLDWDLEAPGLQRYFRPFLVDKELCSSEGLVDFFADFILEAIAPLEEGEELPVNWYVAQANILRYVLSLDWKFPNGGSIDFVPAGRQGADYASRFAAINFQHFYDRLGGGKLLEAAKEQMRANYDYVLIDSRTGVSDTAGISTVQMPDLLVVCFTFNNQSIEGAASVTRDAFEQHKQSLFHSADEFRVIPVPTRVDQSEHDMLKRRKVYARWRFAEFVERYVPPGEVKAFWNAVEVPYLAYFSYEEILAPFREDATDPKTCLAAFVRVANQIASPDKLDYVSLISPEQQAAVLKEFASTPVPAPDGASPAGPPDQGAVTAESPIERQLRIADTIFMTLGEKDRDAARRLWTRLVRVPGRGERVDLAKVRVPVRDLEGLAEQVEKFKAEALLVRAKDPETKQETVEAVSDDLVRGWKQLRDWINADREFLIWRQQLQASMVRWEAKPGTSSELLKGEALAEAARFYPEHRADLNEAEAEYVGRSFDEHQRSRRKVYRSLAFGGAAFLLLLVLFVAGAKLYVRSNSNYEAAQKLADEAGGQFASPAETTAERVNRLQLGLLLAVEAERLSPLTAADAALRQYLPMLPRRVSVTPESENVLSVALTADGKSFVAVTGRGRSIAAQSGPPQEDRTVQLQDVATGRVITRMAFRPNSRIFDLSPDGRYLAVLVDGGITGPPGGARKPSIDVIDVAKGESKLTHYGAVRTMAFSPDGRFFAASGDDGVTTLRELDGVAATSFNLSGAGVSVAFSPDGKFCATSSDAPEIKMWPVPLKGAAAVNQDSRPAPPTIRLKSVVINFAISPEGRYLAAVSYNNSDSFTFWDATSGSQIGPAFPHSERGDTIEALAFSPDGRYLVTAGHNGTIRVWQVGEHSLTRFKDLSFDGDVYRLDFSPGGEYLVAGGAGSIARIWAVGPTPADGQAADQGDAFKDASFLINQGNVNDVAFSADGSLVATAGADNSVRVWYVNRPLGKDLKQDEACARLTRNMTIDEWNKFMPDSMIFRRTCQEITPR
jgi:WD40 repeat protein/MinD-like ATPase involved in chromosome partitioning or flagellar assembly